MHNSLEEVQRTEALLEDAIRTFAEPATTYSKAAAADVVVAAFRLYWLALERHRATDWARGGSAANEAAYRWAGSLEELARDPESPFSSPAQLSTPTAERLN